MSNLYSLIKNIQTEAKNLDSYVYYNKDTGIIHKVSAINDPTTNFEVATIPREEVMPILTGKKRLEEYIMYTDISSKKLILKLVNDIKTYNTSDTMCYRLPTNTNVPVSNTSSNNDIIIQQDLINKEWKLKISTDTKNFLINTTNPSNETLYFSVTSKFDPNILIRSLEVVLSDLISNDTTSIPFRYEVESSNDNISIYTAKYFNNYIHEIVQ